MQKNFTKFLSCLIFCSIINIYYCADISKNLKKLTEVFYDTPSSSVKLTLIEEQPKCIQMQCKFICFNGKISQIVNNIKSAVRNSTVKCPIIEELDIYNYEFPNTTIYYGFLGEYRDKVKNLYIASSDIRYVEPGAFANGTFKKLSFEKLQLNILHKDFFIGISSDFQSLSIIQKEMPITKICNNFLNRVKYQIKALTMQVGIGCMRNLTATDSLLNNLQIVDFSYNNLSTGLTDKTFNKLSVVEELNLSHSHLTYLPAYIFSGLVETLEHLDLSHNHLHTISENIFGWHEIPTILKIDLNHNNWNCSCELNVAMHKILKYQSSTKVFCERPEIYHEWSVLDIRLCLNSSSTEFTIMPIKTTTLTAEKLSKMPEASCTECVVPTTVQNVNELTQEMNTLNIVTENSRYSLIPTTSSGSGSAFPSPLVNGNVQLECFAAENYNDRDNLVVRWPNLQFVIETQPSLRVNVLIDSLGLNSSYGLIWFSKVTKQYYKMEVNYNEYGLGCFGSVSYLTTVDNLLPAVTYTFCLVFKDRLTISPFSCKSIHVGSNLRVAYSAWLTRDMRATGISLIIFGIVLFTFVGVLMVFVVLKRRPSLLKGSKRVATTSSNSGKIIVFQKDKTMQDFRLKEQMLSKRYSRSTISCNRRSSINSIDSNQSYMNANVYEVIPAYLRLQVDNNIADDSNIYQVPDIVLSNTGYFQPIQTSKSDPDLVRYAEIPCRAKRISNDPLPEVPKDQSPYSLPLNECPNKSDGSELNYVLTLDSPV